MRLATSNSASGGLLLLLCGSILLALAGCREPEPARPGALDLLPLARWAGLAEGQTPSPIRFSMAGSTSLLGEGWTISPGPGDGTAAAVSSQRHASLHLPLGPAGGADAGLVLRLRDPAAATGGKAGVIVTFNGHKVTRLVPGVQWADHEFTLAADWFHQGLNELVLSGEPGRAAFQWLDLTLPGPQVHVTVGDTTRRALISPEPLLVDLPRPLPAGARLDLSLGLASRSGAAEKAGCFRLEGCRPDGTWELLLEVEAEVPGAEQLLGQDDCWVDQTLLLDRLPEGPARLRLSCGCFAGAWGPLTLSWPGEDPALDAIAGDGPNLILILADTLRADRLGSGGSAVRLTPSLDALAAESVHFSDTVAQAPSTFPSISSFFTGRYYNSLTRWTDRRQLPPGLQLLAEAMAAGGCRTVAVVANPLLLPETGFARGFDEYHLLPGVPKSFHGREELPVHQSAEVVNARFLQRLPFLSRGRFFAYLHYMDPHDPYPVERSVDQDPRFSEGGLAGVPWEGWLGPAMGDIISHDGSTLGSRDREMVVQAYDEGVSRFDRQLGLLLAHLRRRGLLSNTVVAVVADHGEEFFEHGLLGHGHTVYNELLRVPALVRFPRQPGYPGPALVGRPVELLDVAATLLDVMGAGPLGGHAGTSLLAQGPDGEAAGGDAARYFETRDRFWVEPPLNDYLAGLESEGWKLIRDRRNDLDRLYHLDTDPGETDNLSAVHGEMVRRLGRHLDTWLADQQPLEPGTAGRPRSGSEVEQREVEALKALGYLR